MRQLTKGVRGAMREAVTSHESWVFECLSCLTMWDEEYDARHRSDGHGGDVVVYEQKGQPRPSPWLDHPCPRCSCPNVRAYPAPWHAGAAAPPARPASDLELVFRLRRLRAY